MLEVQTAELDRAKERSPPEFCFWEPQLLNQLVCSLNRFNDSNPRPTNDVRPVFLEYASRRLSPGERRLKRIGIASLVVGLLSGIILGGVIVAQVVEFSQIVQDQHQRPEAYESEFNYRFGGAVLTSIMAIFFVLLAVLLIRAAMMLIRLNARGIVLHRIYAGLQILGSIPLSIILMLIIYNSPAGMIFYMGIAPGLIGCIYPLVILSLLGITRE